MAVIEAKTDFIQVLRQVFRIHLVPGSHDAALEQAESRLNRIRMNIPMRVLFGVVNRLVLVLLNLRECPRVNLGFVGHNDFDGCAQVVVDNGNKRDAGKRRCYFAYYAR